MNDFRVHDRPLDSFVLTQEFKRFQEFAISCTKFRYIGICHGEPGVGKSLAALKYTNWSENITDENLVEDITSKNKKIVNNCKGVLVTVPVTNTPKIIHKQIFDRTFKFNIAKVKASGELDKYKWLVDSDKQCQLVILDEADRLNMNALEEVRSLYDQEGFGLILIGMPGIEKRFSRYPQLYSRIGFSHEFKRLSEDEMRFLFPRFWTNLGIEYNPSFFSDVEV